MRKLETTICNGPGSFLGRETRPKGEDAISRILDELVWRMQRDGDVGRGAKGLASPALSDDDRALHAALRFGRPQIMAANGRWDNARYMRPISGAD